MEQTSIKIQSKFRQFLAQQKYQQIQKENKTKPKSKNLFKIRVKIKPLNKPNSKLRANTAKLQNESLNSSMRSEVSNISINSNEIDQSSEDDLNEKML
jgi:hypothetical protein